jgi:hypothetical protein
MILAFLAGAAVLGFGVLTGASLVQGTISKVVSELKRDI